MIDITDSMLAFREAVRHTWNTFLVGGGNATSPETQEAFLSIERALLRIMVFSPHGVGDLANSYRSSVFSRVLIRPASITAQLPIRFGQRDANLNVVWDIETTIEVDEVVKFNLIDFFDWYPYGQIDMAFVRVREENQGRLALIEQRYCNFILDAE